MNDRVEYTDVLSDNEKNKALRVCLAMGGGVSLGTFSGAALTESLKLLIIYGKYIEEDNVKKLIQYDDIIVDGMSGASAGTVALTVMLRCLFDYKGMIKHLNQSDLIGNDIIDEDTFIEKLNKTYFKEKGLDNFLNNKVKDNSEKRLKLKHTLISLELCQFVQEVIWVNTLSIEKLLGETLNKSYKHSKDHSFSLLSRESLSELVMDFLAFDVKDEVEKSSRGILDEDRVIFACSLTSILPVVYYNRFNKGGIKDQAEINSMSSKNHTELRIIDFIFNSKAGDRTDKRWLKFKNNGSNNPKEGVWNYNKEKSWTVIASTALACAAFPVAFSPVLLKRYQYEYYRDIKNKRGELKDLWLERFQNIIEALKEGKKEGDITKNSFFGFDKTNPIDYKSFNLPYIDGGTFNNEPIKEAFKIASFQDYQSNKPSDRLILFVDPSVPINPTRSYQLNSFNGILQDDNKDKKNETYLKSESSKAMSSVGDILATLKDQGSFKEDHKVGNTKEKLSLRNELFEYIDKSQITISEELMTKCEGYVSNFLNKDHLSFGSRDVNSYISSRLNNSELQLDLSALFNKLNNPDLQLNFTEQKSIPNIYSAIKNIYNKKEIETIPGFNSTGLAKELLKLIVDVALDTFGKNSHADLISIFPKKIKDISQEENGDLNKKTNIIGDITEEGELVKLPGHEVEAFAGFGSKRSRKYAFEYGRLSSVKTLYIDYGNTSDLNNSTSAISLSNLYVDFQENVKASKFYDNEYSYSKELDTSLFKHMLNRLINIYNTRSLKKGSSNWLMKKWDSIKYFFLFLSKKCTKVQHIIIKELDPSKNINSTKISSISIRIIGKQDIKTKKVLLKSENNFIKHKCYRVSKKEIEFKLFITNFEEQIYISYQEYMQNPDKNGKLIDPNLYPKLWAKEIIDQHPFLESIQLGNKNISFKNLNKKNQTLYYSLLHIDAHINPYLEYNLDKNEWSFIENTESLSEELTKKIDKK